MESRHFVDKDGGFRVIVSSKLIDKIINFCSISMVIEIGGILIGSYSKDSTTATLFEITAPPPDSKSGRDWFERGTTDTEKYLQQCWNSEPPTYYIGEWHSHTANVPQPSQQDIHQMTIIARDPQYHCTTPLLFIAFLAERRRWMIKAYVFFDNAPFIELTTVTE